MRDWGRFSRKTGEELYCGKPETYDSANRQGGTTRRVPSSDGSITDRWQRLLYLRAAGSDQTVPHQRVEQIYPIQIPCPVKGIARKTSILLRHLRLPSRNGICLSLICFL